MSKRENSSKHSSNKSSGGSLLGAVLAFGLLGVGVWYALSTQEPPEQRTPPAPPSGSVSPSQSPQQNLLQENPQRHGQSIPQADEDMAALCQMPTGCQKLCDAGAAISCHRLAGAYLSGEENLERDLKRGVALALRGCELGEPTACVMAAYRIRRGDGVEKDPERALQLDSKACEAGESAGCHNLAYAHLTGQGTKKDPEKATRLYRTACDKGDRDSCRDLATLAVVGAMGVQQDAELARSLAEKACADKGAPACLDAGLALLKEEQPARARLLFETMCEQGTGFGCNNLGVLAEQGIGEPENAEKALELYARACGNGDLQGCRNRAIVGLSEGGSRADARAWMERGCAGDGQKACDQLAQGALNPKTQSVAISLVEELGCEKGQAVSCSNFAASLMSGLGVPPDSERGMSLFEKACNDGLPLACRNLAGNLATGREGLPPDPVAARKAAQRGCHGDQKDACFNDAQRWTQPAARLLLMEVACEEGQLDACNSLGVAFDNAEGVTTENPKRARALFQAACDGGHELGCRNLALLLLLGRGGEQDDGAAKTALSKGCTAAESDACVSRAAAFEDGETAHVARAFAEAACTAGNGRACNSLGYYLLKGIGGAASQSQSAELFKESCESGHGMGCKNLGVAYRDGVGVAADAERAVSFFEQGCKLDEPRACAIAAHHYSSEGSLTAADPDLARKYALRACALGDEDTCTDLKLSIEDAASQLPP